MDHPSSCIARLSQVLETGAVGPHTVDDQREPELFGQLNLGVKGAPLLSHWDIAADAIESRLANGDDVTFGGDALQLSQKFVQSFSVCWDMPGM